jgi:hypothetical protein
MRKIQIWAECTECTDIKKNIEEFRLLRGHWNSEQEINSETIQNDNNIMKHDPLITFSAPFKNRMLLGIC